MSNCPSVHPRRRPSWFLATGILLCGLLILMHNQVTLPINPSATALGSWRLIAKAQSPQQPHIILAIDCSGSMKDLGAEAHDRMRRYLKKLLFEGISQGDLAAGDEIIVPAEAKPVPEIVAQGLCGGSCQVPSFIFSYRITDTLTIREPGDIGAMYPDPVPFYTNLGDALAKVCGLDEANSDEGLLWVLVSDDLLEQPGPSVMQEQQEIIRKLRDKYSVHALFSIRVQGEKSNGYVEVRRVLSLDIIRVRLDKLEKQVSELMQRIEGIIEQLKRGEKPTDVDRVLQEAEKAKSEVEKLPTVPEVEERVRELERKVEELRKNVAEVEKLLPPTNTWTPIKTPTPGHSATPTMTDTTLPPTDTPTPPCPGSFKGFEPQVSGTRVTFAWEGVAGAEKYELRVVQGRLSVATPQTTETSIPLELKRGGYQWQVVAIGRQGCPEMPMAGGPRSLRVTGTRIDDGNGNGRFPWWLPLGLLIAIVGWLAHKLLRAQWVRLSANSPSGEVQPKEFELGISAGRNRVFLSEQDDPAYCYDLEAPEHWVERRICGYYLCHQGAADTKPAAERLRLGVPATFERRLNERVELTLEIYAPPSEPSEAQEQQEQGAAVDTD